MPFQSAVAVGPVKNLQTWFIWIIYIRDLDADENIYSSPKCALNMVYPLAVISTPRVRLNVALSTEKRREWQSTSFICPSKSLEGEKTPPPELISHEQLSQSAVARVEVSETTSHSGRLLQKKNMQVRFQGS